MQLLFVEDNKTYAETVIDSLGRIPGIQVTRAASRRSALDALAAGFFDAIVLDLSLPLEDNFLDDAPEHGQAVFHQAREVAPGTPIFILTGSDPDEFQLSLTRYGHQADVWGAGTPISTIVHYVKDRVDELLVRLKEMSLDVSITDAITVDTRGRALDVSAEQRRALKVFTRLRGGVSCVAQKLTGGLSGARTLKVSVIDENGNVKVLCVAKLGHAEHIQTENAAFDSHVELLRMGAATPRLNHLHMGLGRFAGIFYSLAEGYDDTFFDLVKNKPAEAPNVVKKLREALQRWIGVGTVRQVKIRDIRRRLVDDDSLNKILSNTTIPRLAEIEDIEVRAYEACIHGDLHGGNVLVTQGGAPVLIDFGDVGHGYTCLDPVTLELSLAFHPEYQSNLLSKPFLDDLENWPNIEKFMHGTPYAATIEACRDWAHDHGGSDRAVLAAGFAYGVRQLKYNTVPKEKALALINSIAKQLLDQG